MWSPVVFLALIAGISASADVLQDVPNENPESRILGGWQAREGQFPYMLYLRVVRWTGRVNACGGSIIHRSWGLTAARCAAQTSSIVVSAGSVSRQAPRVLFETSSYFTHPEYNDVMNQISQPNDIGLINFQRQLNFDNFLQPVRLQPSRDMNREYAGLRLTTSGWGTTFTCQELDCPTPVILNWVHLVGVNNFMCRLMHNSNFLVRDSTICAGPYNNNIQSICTGDAGVPLVETAADGLPTQVGVASFVHWLGCDMGMPGGFVRPGHYHTWIRTVTGVNFDWLRSGEQPALEENVATN